MAKITHQQWENLFDIMALQDYVVIDDFLEEETLNKVVSYFAEKEQQNTFKKAAIGTLNSTAIINEIRGDYTFWLDKQRDGILNPLFDILDEVKLNINQMCFLSLSEYEFHLAHYPKGTYYKRHLDQFAERNNRMISMVIYLNKNWKMEDGGELRIYPNNNDYKDINPIYNRCILFRSDFLEHEEVLVAHADRRSVTGWMLYKPTPLAILGI